MWKIRFSLRFIALMIPTIILVVASFEYVMNRLERNWALKDLHHRGQVIFDSIQDPVLESVRGGRLSQLLRIYARYDRDPFLSGVVVCSSTGVTISKSSKTPKWAQCDWDFKDNPTLESARKASGLLPDQGVHRSYFPLFEGDSTDTTKFRAYVVILHNLTFISEKSAETKQYAQVALIILGLLISILALIVYRWSHSRPMEQISEVMKGVITGDAAKISQILENTEFAPLVKDFDQIVVEKRREKTQQKGNGNHPKWNPISLSQEVQKIFGDSRLVMIASTEPYIHERRGGKVEIKQPANGLVSSLEPVIRATSGLWIGHGSGSADQENADKTGMLLVPPGAPEYALKRVWLSRDEEQGFANGFAHEGLWPMCHIAHERPRFRQADWEQYVEVNAKFANAFNEEVSSPRPVVLIQNHHFALLPGMIRKTSPDALISLFWHIPWPNPETVRICPWTKDLLTGMLDSDVIGFQLQEHCNNFLATVEDHLEAQVSRENFSVTYQGKTCVIKPYPIGIDYAAGGECAPEEIPAIRTSLLEEYSLPADSLLGVCVDRLDYTKGIVERFKAIERALEKDKHLIGKLVFIQVVSPSRMHVKRYQDMSSEIQKEADRINWRFYSSNYQPIVLRHSYHSREEIFRIYRAADFCFINSIHDGMNLVAKEFVLSRSDLNGVLILSNFTGAARELKDALLINPYSVNQGADAIIRALEMSPEQRRMRMQRMRSHVRESNVYAWAVRYLRELKAAGDAKLSL